MTARKRRPDQRSRGTARHGEARLNRPEKPRRLTLLRHGHAAEHPDDFERQLSSEGRAAALRAGEALRRSGWLPSHVLASAAPRALATAELAARACGYTEEISVEPSLYLASPARCREILRRTPERCMSVLLVGHNPGLSQLARDLAAYTGDLMPAEHASVELGLDAWLEL